MGRKVKETKSKAISVTIEPDLYDQLLLFAEKDERSMSYVVGKAIREFLERKDK